jgi:transposase
MEIRTLGIDLGKTSFHVVGLDHRGHIVVRRRLSRAQLMRFVAQLPPCLVGMEACCGAHYLGRTLSAAGHDVCLMPPQYVRPYVKSQKNDYQDAEAIAEAVQRPTMRFVPLKTEDQLDLQALHRVRDRLVSRRTAVINQLRAFLLERGLTPRTGRRHLARELPVLLEDADNGLSSRMREILNRLRREWAELETSIREVTQDLETVARTDAACQRLVEIPGFGPLVSTAFVAAIGKGTAFRKGRDLSAWLGLVPRQHSTGGKPRLLGITKRGLTPLRRLLINGARSVYRLAHRATLGMAGWLRALEARAHPNVVVVALANKLARIAWAVLTRGEPYRPTHVVAVPA